MKTPTAVLGFTILAALFAAAALPGQENPSGLALQVYGQILVEDPQEAGDALVLWAQDNGGYFTEKSLDFVRLRVPADRVEDLRSFLTAAFPRVLSLAPQAEDLRERRADLVAAIDSRNRTLDRLLAFLDEADSGGLVTFQQEITSLLFELERLTGSLRALDNNVRFAQVELALSTRRQPIPVSPASSFPWLNSLGLGRFLGEVSQ